MAKILIVEDNQGTNKAICEYMKEAGHTLFSAFTGSEALKIFREKELDIIVLDIMLPEMSGIVVLHEIRKISNIPVIMLTALDDEYTQSNSFDEMADDYITKPFSMLILGKRITALLRRSQNKPAVNTVKLGDITVDFSGYTASDENGKIDITPKELEILKVLIDNILPSRKQTTSLMMNFPHGLKMKRKIFKSWSMLENGQKQKRQKHLSITMKSLNLF